MRRSDTNTQYPSLTWRVPVRGLGDLPAAPSRAAAFDWASAFGNGPSEVQAAAVWVVEGGAGALGARATVAASPCSAVTGRKPSGAIHRDHARNRMFAARNVKNSFLAIPETSSPVWGRHYAQKPPARAVRDQAVPCSRA